MGYRRREPTPPTQDEIDAVAYLRSRASEIGIHLLMTDSRLRQVLYKFIDSRCKCGVFYKTVAEAARSYWDQDEQFFKVFALIFKIAREKR